MKTTRQNTTWVWKLFSKANKQWYVKTNLSWIVLLFISTTLQIKSLQAQIIPVSTLKTALGGSSNYNGDRAEGFIGINKNNTYNYSYIAWDQAWNGTMKYDRLSQIFSISKPLSILSSGSNASAFRLKIDTNTGISSLSGDMALVVPNNKKIRFKVGNVTSTTDIASIKRSYIGEPEIELNKVNGWSRISATGSLAFLTNNRSQTTANPNMLLHSNGSVVISAGSAVPFISSTHYSKYGLFVKKGILSEDYSIGPQSTWADYVFSKEYIPTPLNQLETYIKKHQHLPNIPSQDQVKKEGYSLHEINVKLLEKIEELTLYTIQQQHELEELKHLYNQLIKTH